MTRTILVTDFTEITNIKISCKKCGYAANFPCKSLNSLSMPVCPSCGMRFPLSDDSVEGFFNSLKAILSNLKDDPNFKNIKFEIETEEKQQKT